MTPSLGNRLRSPSSQEIVATLRGLLEEAMTNLAAYKRWEDVYDVLEALPLPTGRFGVVVARLRNAQVYVEHGEFGAARFELRQVLRKVE